MTQDSTGREVIGLTDAANLAGVTHQTIRNWAQDGIINVGTEPGTLARMNEGKNGRRHERYYFTDEIRAHATIQPHPGLISIEEAAEQLGVTRRTIHRIRARQNLPTFTGPSQTVYLRRSDIDRQVLGETYWQSTRNDTETEDSDAPVEA